jgi:raffinose/stachyose/melibiose transport system substrate-binding protein
MNKYFHKTAFLMAILIIVLSACAGGAADDGQPSAGGEEVTLRVLVHQNPPMVEFVEGFNAAFEEKYPNVTVDMSVVNANDLSTITQTRLTANDVDWSICLHSPMRPSLIWPM